MLFPAILACFLLIGSSAAQTPLEKMIGLQKIHHHIKTYVGTLATLTGAARLIAYSPVYTSFVAYDTMLLNNVNALISQQLDPRLRIPWTVEQVLRAWKTAATPIINSEVNAMVVAIREDDSKLKDLLNATANTMNRINQTLEIQTSRLVGSNCPIWNNLSSVFIKNAERHQRQWFQNIFANGSYLQQTSLVVVPDTV